MNAKTAICAAVFGIFALLPTLAAGSGSATPKDADKHQSAFNDSRIKFLESSFKRLLEKSGSVSGALCLAENGNILAAKSFPAGREGAAQTFALGKSTAAIVTLAAVAMQNEGKLNLRESAESLCSYFRLSGSARRASLEDIWSGKFGFSEHSDTLVPSDASAAEVFDIAAQIPPAANVGINSSKLAPAIAGYALGYIADKSQKNFKKSFAKALHAYALSPLGMEGAKYRSFDSPFFPATALALTADDAAKWLACETAQNPKIATEQLVSERRIPKSGEKKFSMGWIKTSIGKTNFYMCGDYFQNCANIVAVMADERIAAAFFVKSTDSKSAPQICSKALYLLIEMLQNPIPPSK